MDNNIEVRLINAAALVAVVFIITCFAGCQMKDSAINLNKAISACEKPIEQVQ